MFLIVISSPTMNKLTIVIIIVRIIIIIIIIIIITIIIIIDLLQGGSILNRSDTGFNE